MFEWLFNLFVRRPGISRIAPPLRELPPRSFPTSESISEWDDQGLYVATGCESALRYGRDGFDALNDAERSLCCLYLLEAEVNNGGFGQWIDNLCPLSAAVTPCVLLKIGATDMAALVDEVLVPLGDTSGLNSREEWIERYMSMPDPVHEHWETLTKPYLQLEARFLKLAYKYARDHWGDVRAL